MLLLGTQASLHGKINQILCCLFLTNLYSLCFLLAFVSPPISCSCSLPVFGAEVSTLRGGTWVEPVLFDQIIPQYFYLRICLSKLCHFK